MSVSKISEKQWLFIGESGKPEVFSSKGVNLVEKGVATKFLILAAVRCEDQLNLQQQYTDFKSLLLHDESLIKMFSSAYTLDSFHAQTDYPQVKEKFYNFINSLPIKIDVLVAEKLKCYPALKQNPGKMYGVMVGQLLKNLCHQARSTEIIFSRKDSKLKLRQELEAEVERVRLEYLEKHLGLNAELKLSYYHNPHYSHGGLQIADYVSYSVFQIYEFSNWKWYQMIKDKIGRIQDICNKKYFTRSNPLELST
jgi:hypothetical protein